MGADKNRRKSIFRARNTGYSSAGSQEIIVIRQHKETEKFHDSLLSLIVADKGDDDDDGARLYQNTTKINNENNTLLIPAYTAC